MKVEYEEETKHSGMKQRQHEDTCNLFRQSAEGAESQTKLSASAK